MVADPVTASPHDVGHRRQLAIQVFHIGEPQRIAGEKAIGFVPASGLWAMLHDNSVPFPPVSLPFVSLLRRFIRRNIVQQWLVPAEILHCQ